MNRRNFLQQAGFAVGWLAFHQAWAAYAFAASLAAAAIAQIAFIWMFGKRRP